jgi:hypothetical protein
MSEPTHTPGIYRRLIDLQCHDARTVTAWMEDDYHHFGVTVVHDGQTVLDIHAAAPRYPWSTCPGAADALRALIGKPLISRASDIGLLIDMRTQCTHMFDLTGLALAHAAQRREHRRYEVSMPDRAFSGSPATGVVFGPTTVTLKQDGQCVMQWGLDGQFITAPPDSAGQSLQKGFREWTEAMPEQEAEYATILRRAIMVGSGRLIDLSHIETADQLGNPAVCYTFQPERRKIALHEADSIRDHTAGSQEMLKETPRIL